MNGDLSIDTTTNEVFRFIPLLAALATTLIQFWIDANPLPANLNRCQRLPVRNDRHIPGINPTTP
jgi:hypothetical protein